MDILYKFQNVVQTLQIIGCHFGMKPPEWEYPKHYHQLYEILCCIEGEAELKVEGDKVTLLQGDWIVIKSGVQHAVSNPSPSQFIFFNVHFDIDDTESRMRLGAVPYSKIPASVAQGSKLPAYTLELEALLQNGLLSGTVQKQDDEQLITLPNEKRLSLQAYTLLTIEEILTLVQKQHQNAPGRHQNASPFIMKIAHAIEQRLADGVDQEVTIEAIAKQLNLSRSQCCKSFSKVYGISPRQYMSRLKLNRAKQLLLTTTLTVGEIAERLGFQSVNHFSRQFRRWTGMSPNPYRLNQAADAAGDGAEQ